MASPKTPALSNSLSSRGLSITPGTRVLNTPLSDETIWTRLKEAGIDEESIKRRDKAALVSYIANLESQIFDLHHHLGLHILEKKELASQYEQLKASSDSSELVYRRQQVAHLATLAEYTKREENLKRALGIEKECIASLEKALHEIRAESAEWKVVAESKISEAYSAMENANKKDMEATMKLQSAESLLEEANRLHRSSEIKLLEVETRDADLCKRVTTFQSECEDKEKQTALENQELNKRRETLQEEHERLLDAKILLNQREEHVACKMEELRRLEKELELSIEKAVKELRAIREEKSNLDISTASLAQRELAVIEKETALNKRENDLIAMEENILRKEHVETQKLIAHHDMVFRSRSIKLETELELKHKEMEDEYDSKRRNVELREIDICERQILQQEKEEELEMQLRVLSEKERDLNDREKLLDKKEKSLDAFENDLKKQRAHLELERIEIDKKNIELNVSLNSFAEKSKQVEIALEKLEILKSETNDLSALEVKLKEEIDNVRAQKIDIALEEERMKQEKAKFESEWELIDDKREELLKEAELIAADKKAVSKTLIDERENLILEIELMKRQHMKDVELLSKEREDYTNKLELERLAWFNEIQKEHADFLLGIEMQKRELEYSSEKRREEVESYLREKEKAFDMERKIKLQELDTVMIQISKEREQVASEMNKLDTERKEIIMEREQREKEWLVLKESIEELKQQTMKLEEQREALHLEREEICSQIEHLRKLEDLSLEMDSTKVSQMQQYSMETSHRKLSASRSSKRSDLVKIDTDSSPSFAFSWIKRYADTLFKSPAVRSSKVASKYPNSGDGDTGLASVGKFLTIGTNDVAAEGETVARKNNKEFDIDQHPNWTKRLQNPEDLLSGKKRLQTCSSNQEIYVSSHQTRSGKKRKENPDSINLCNTPSMEGLSENHFTGVAEGGKRNKSPKGSENILIDELGCLTGREMQESCNITSDHNSQGGGSSDHISSGHARVDLLPGVSEAGNKSSLF